MRRRRELPVLVLQQRRQLWVSVRAVISQGQLSDELRQLRASLLTLRSVSRAPCS